MEKTLTYEEYVKIKNLLTKIKGDVALIDRTNDEIIKTLSEINGTITK